VSVIKDGEGMGDGWRSMQWWLADTLYHLEGPTLSQSEMMQVASIVLLLSSAWVNTNVMIGT
jgi:hypothetical protein